MPSIEKGFQSKEFPEKESEENNLNAQFENLYQKVREREEKADDIIGKIEGIREEVQERAKERRKKPINFGFALTRWKISLPRDLEDELEGLMAEEEKQADIS